jgi:hypothetical protein
MQENFLRQMEMAMIVMILVQDREKLGGLELDLLLRDVMVDLLGDSLLKVD